MSLLSENQKGGSSHILPPSDSFYPKMKRKTELSFFEKHNTNPEYYNIYERNASDRSGPAMLQPQSGLG